MGVSCAVYTELLSERVFSNFVIRTIRSLIVRCKLPTLLS